MGRAVATIVRAREPRAGPVQALQVSVAGDPRAISPAIALADRSVGAAKREQRARVDPVATLVVDIGERNRDTVVVFILGAGRLEPAPVVVLVEPVKEGPPGAGRIVVLILLQDLLDPERDKLDRRR